MEVNGRQLSLLLLKLFPFKHGLLQQSREERGGEERRKGKGLERRIWERGRENLGKGLERKIWGRGWRGENLGKG